MLNLLHSEDMRRQFMGFLQILTFQEQFQKFFIIILSADAPVLNLYDQGCILNNVAYNIAGDLQYFFSFAFLSPSVHEPVFQGIPFSVYIFPDARLGISMYFQQCMGNIQFTCHNPLQNRILHTLCILFQQLFHPFGMPLQFLHKLIQVFDKFVLMNHEFHGFHQFFRFPGVKVPQIILIILVESFKILLQRLPPFVHRAKLCILHVLRLIQTSLQTDKKVGR